MPTSETIYRPRSRPQEAFLSNKADICIMGGARGGGKTYGLQLESGRWLHRSGFYGVLLRNTLVAIKKPGGMWDEGYPFYDRLGGTPNKSELSWRFPAGSKMNYGHLETNSAIESWRGAQVGFIGIDQLELIKEHAFWPLLGSGRSMTGIKPYVRATCNPDPDCFLYKNGDESGLITWWINTDTGYPIPERSGKIRWFVRDDDRMVWDDRPEPLMAQYPGSMPLSVSFVPATVYDNQILLQTNPRYLAMLMALPLVERLRMLGGNWKIKAAAGTTLQGGWFRPQSALPLRWRRLLRFWDLAGTVPSETNQDPDWTAGVLMGLDEMGVMWILDVRRFRKATGAVELEIKRTAIEDGRHVEIMIEQEGGSSGIGWPDSIIRNHLAGFQAKRDKPKGSKLARARIMGGLAEHGRINVPDNDRLDAKWLPMFLNECESFTDGSQSGHDDMVDAASAASIELSMSAGLYEPFEVKPVERGEVIGFGQAPPGAFLGSGGDNDYYDDGGDFESRFPGLGLR